MVCLMWDLDGRDKSRPLSEMMELQDYEARMAKRRWQLKESERA